MKTFLVDGNPQIDKIDAVDWAAAEAKLAGVGNVLGELVEESKSNALACGLTEVKFADSGDAPMTFTGYGAFFNNIDSGGDRILPGAFTETIAQFKAAGRQPTMYYEHGQRGGGPAMPVGVWTSVSEDSHGLRVEGKLADTTNGRDLYVLMKAGAIGGLSIGYRAKELGRPSAQSGERRQIKAAQLIEVSLVNDPMNPMARFLSVKSAEEIVTIRDLEATLRDAGHSKADAVRICARFQAKTNQGEPDQDAAIAEALRRNLSLINS